MSQRAFRRLDSLDIQPVVATILIGIALAQLFGLDERLRSRGARFANGADRPADPRAEGQLRALEPDRGRTAARPEEIPPKGWKDILWRVYQEAQHDRVMLVSAGVTFYLLLALFPATAAVVSLYGLFADALTINEHLASLSGILPGGAIEILGDQVKRIAAKGNGTLGAAFFTALAISLWSANSGMKSILDALNIVYDEEEKRDFIKLNLQSLAFTLAAILFILTAVAATVVLPLALDYIGLKTQAAWLISIGRWPALLLVTMFAFACLYRYGPSRRPPRWAWVTWGSAVAAVIWIVGSMAFSWYIGNFGKYNETYGSLGAAIGFMTWTWLSVMVLLVGAEINAETEHQTARDSTEGQPKPMGARQAKMADEVGPAVAA